MVWAMCLRWALVLPLLLSGSSACGRGEGASSRGAAGASAIASARIDTRSGPRLVVSEALTGGAASTDVLPLVILLSGDEPPPALEERLRGLTARARLMTLPAATAASLDLGGDAERLGQTIARLAERRPSRGKPILLGAGRGGTVALALAARAPRTLAAVIVVGADFLPETVPPGPPPDAGKPPLRVYIHHGSRDEIVPVAKAGAASDELALRGLAAVLHLDPRAGHEISPHLQAELLARLGEEIRDLP